MPPGQAPVRGDAAGLARLDSGLPALVGQRGLPGDGAERCDTRWAPWLAPSRAELRPADGPDRDEKALRQEALAHLQRLGRLGRAAGIHLILSTQRPDANTVEGQVKGQCAGRIAFYCADHTMSEIILDNKAASSLPPWAGRGIWKWDRQIQFQAPLLESKDCVKLLDRAYPARHDQPVEEVAA